MEYKNRQAVACTFLFRRYECDSKSLYDNEGSGGYSDKTHPNSIPNHANPRRKSPGNPRPNNDPVRDVASPDIAPRSFQMPSRRSRL